VLNSVQRIVRDLEREFPAYQVWNVPHAVGPSIWAAKRHDGKGKIHNEITPEQLREKIRAEVDALTDPPRDDTQDVPGSFPAAPAHGWLS
jgi:hypothetical protein